VNRPNTSRVSSNTRTPLHAGHGGGTAGIPASGPRSCQRSTARASAAAHPRTQRSDSPPASTPTSTTKPDIEAEDRAQPRLLHTPEQAAALLQVPASWLRKKAAAGDIPRTKIGRHLRFSDADLNAIIRHGSRNPH
jgi:excisionase family DNA binding protein